MFGQTLNQVKKRTLKTRATFTLSEISYCCHVIGERMEITMIGVDPYMVYRIVYPLF